MNLVKLTPSSKRSAKYNSSFPAIECFKTYVHCSVYEKRKSGFNGPWTDVCYAHSAKSSCYPRLYGLFIIQQQGVAASKYSLAFVKL